MANYLQDTLYKIGTASDKLISLRDLGIAVPNQVTFQGASLYYTRADLSRVGDGFAICSWIWDTISLVRLANLLQFLNGGTSAAVYIQTDKRDGTIALPANAFKVYSATMWKPLIFGQEGTPIVNSPYAIQTVHIQFVGLEVVE